MKISLGLLEVSGLALAINTADAMVKSAAVTLVGIDTAKGGGWMTIKITGDVAAVNAALSTGAALAEKHSGLVAKALLARPDEQLLQQVVPATPVKQPQPEPAPVTTSEPDAEVRPTTSFTAAEVVESATEASEFGAQEIEPEAAPYEGQATCNLCQDPLCPRQKGEPRNKCLHARGHA